MKFFYLEKAFSPGVKGDFRTFYSIGQAAISFVFRNNYVKIA